MSAPANPDGPDRTPEPTPPPYPPGHGIGLAPTAPSAAQVPLWRIAVDRAKPTALRWFGKVPPQWRTGPVLILSALVLALTVSTVTLAATRPSSAAPPAAAGLGSEAGDEPTPTPTRSRVWPDLAPEDLGIAILITEKQCFGSAGCNVNFEPQLSLLAEKAFERGSTWLITYNVYGAEDLFTGSIDLTFTGPDRFEYSYRGAFVSTRRASDELRGEVTAVRERL